MLRIVQSGRDGYVGYLEESALGEPGAQSQEQLRVDEGDRLGRSAVINLIEVETLPSSLEERIAAAIQPMVADRVTVRRIRRGD